MILMIETDKEIEMRHAGGRKESMRIQLGIAVLYACPGMKAREASEAAAMFYGPKATLKDMKERIALAGGFMKAGISAFHRWDSANPLQGAANHE